MNTLDYANKLEFEQFVQYMKEHIFDKDAECAASVNVRINEVKKNNGILLTGLTFVRENENISPTIYLEGFYREYKEGKSLEVCTRELYDSYICSRPYEMIDIGFFEDFDSVKENLYPRVINTEMNRHMLDEMPHFEYGDLSIGFFVDYDNPDKEIKGSIRILNEHLDRWEITPRELLDAAMENDRNKKNYEIKPMISILSDMFDEEVSDLFFEGMRGDHAMYVLKGEKGYYDATSMIYPDIFEEHAQYINDSFYVLPSSLHELILVSAQSELCHGLKHFKEMVKEINDTEVAREEVLSYNVYFYDQEEKALFRTDTGEKMQIVDNTPVIKMLINSKDLEPKKDSIKEKMEGYKAVVKTTEPVQKNGSKNMIRE